MSSKIEGNKITTTVEVDLGYIQEYCYSATNIELTDKETSEQLKKMPENIICGIIQWGESDSVVRDNIFEWFEANPPKKNVPQNRRYIDVVWKHKSDIDPIKITSEISSEGYEERRINSYKDGSYSLASEDIKDSSIELSDQIIPDIQEINKIDGFYGVEITKEVFEKLWDIAKRD